MSSGSKNLPGNRTCATSIATAAKEAVTAAINASAH
jgi:hypothetical protein